MSTAVSPPSPPLSQGKRIWNQSTPSTAPTSPRSVAPPAIPTKHGIANCNKTRHILSYQGGMRQPGRRKRAPREGKKSETSQKDTKLHNITYMQST